MNKENVLIQTEQLRGIVSSVAGIFLNVYLFKVGGVSVVAWYNAATFIALYPAYFSAGYLLKTYTSRDLVRWGFAGLTVVYLLVFLLGERSTAYAIPLGVLTGIAYAFYWAGFNVVEYLTTKSGTRHSYFGRIRMWSNVVRALAPLLGGGIVTATAYFALSKEAGYNVLFFVLAISLAVGFLHAARLPAHGGVEFAGGHIVRNTRSRRWLTTLVQQFVIGFGDSSVAAVVPILMFVILQEEFTLGAVGTAGLLFAGAGSYLAGRLLQGHSGRFLWGAILAPIGLIAFALNQNMLGILALIASQGLFLPLLNISIDKTYYDTMDGLAGEWSERYHYIIEREFALGAGRVLSFLILIALLSSGDQVAVAANWLLVVAACPLIAGGLQYLISREKA